MVAGLLAESIPMGDLSWSRIGAPVEGLDPLLLPGQGEHKIDGPALQGARRGWRGTVGFLWGSGG